MRLVLWTLTALALLVGTVEPISAQTTVFIDSRSELTPGYTEFDFSGVPVGTGGTISSGNLSVSGNTADCRVRDNFFTPVPGLVGDRWFGVFGGESTPDYTFEFATPIAQFGVGILDVEISGTQLVALNGTGQVVASTSMPFGTYQESIFRGFRRTTADIKTVKLLHFPGDQISVGTISYSTTPASFQTVPEPAGVALFLPACIALVLVQRRQLLR